MVLCSNSIVPRGVALPTEGVDRNSNDTDTIRVQGVDRNRLSSMV